MKYLLKHVWLVAVLFTACGDDGPTGPSVWEIPLVDGLFSIDPGSHLNYRFVVDLSLMTNPAVVANITTAGGVGETINILILSDENFNLWQASEPYVAVFESGQTAGGTLDQGVDTNGVYHLVLSNQADAETARPIGITASVFYEIPAP